MAISIRNINKDTLNSHPRVFFEGPGVSGYITFYTIECKDSK